MINDNWRPMISPKRDKYVTCHPVKYLIQEKVCSDKKPI